MNGATASGPIGIDSVSVSESYPSSLFQKKFHSDLQSLLKILFV